MKTLFQLATTKETLRRAWYRIRSNGNRSRLPETRDAIREFEQNAERNIANIQRTLRDTVFEFLPQKGILKTKRSGGKRGIVMAPVRNRIVERACLDCMQDKVPFVGQVISTPTSIGGVPDRSVPHGLYLLRSAFSEGKSYFIRSDISGFFDAIPRKQVLDILATKIDDKIFLDLLDKATTVILENEQSLGEDRKVFPTDDDGVAQGSPLSPLFGNILLNQFDNDFNQRGIICIRFIDDFILLGEKEGNVKRAFSNAKDFLSNLELRCHDPFLPNTSKDKAQYGDTSSGFVFLGYDIRPGLLQPSQASRVNLLEKVDRHIRHGRAAIADVIKTQNSSDNRQRYGQTLEVIDKLIRGWGNAFSYSNAKDTRCGLDVKIDKKLDAFRNWFFCYIEKLDDKAKRRGSGVCLLEDIAEKGLDELPFRLEKKKNSRATKNLIAISTDGSVITGPRRRKDKGPGGWAAVFHSGEEFSGCEANTTNNRMELIAVIEALKRTLVGSRVRIRTDSQYVYQAAESSTIIRSNHDLWEEFSRLRNERQVSVLWLRGHRGDVHNERADALANEQARSLIDS